MLIAGSIDSSMLNRILIVDDDDDFLHFVAIMVKVHYPAVVVQLAHDGSDALAIIAREPPAVVITDIAMPQLDGNALCRMVQEKQGDHVKIIAMTANRWSIDAHFDAIVSKPFSIDALFNAIDQTLGNRQQESITRF